MYLTSFPAEPAVLTGATVDWPAHRRWSWEFFGQFADDSMALTNAQGESAGEAALGDYLRALHVGRGPLAALYASGWRFFERHPALLGDFSEPAAAVPDMLQRIPERLFKPLLWLFIGPEGSGTGLHHDVLDTHAWLAVIHGRKRLAMHPPASLDADFERHGADAAMVLQQRHGQGRWRYLELRCGDLLLIPSGWWHQVVNEGLTLGLTRNFATPDIRSRVASAAHALRLNSILPWLDDTPGQAPP